MRGHHGFPDGITGTIRMPPPFLYEARKPGAWDGCRLTLKSQRGWHVFYFVEFDEPHDDGSGDGPYRGCELLIENLEPFNQ